MQDRCTRSMTRWQGTGRSAARVSGLNARPPAAYKTSHRKLGAPDAIEDIMAHRNTDDRRHELPRRISQWVGAAEVVAPPTLAAACETRPSVGSRSGAKHRTGSRKGVMNQGEKRITMKTEGGGTRVMTFQVADITKPVPQATMMRHPETSGSRTVPMDPHPKGIGSEGGHTCTFPVISTTYIHLRTHDQHSLGITICFAMQLSVVEVRIAGNTARGVCMYVCGHACVHAWMHAWVSKIIHDMAWGFALRSWAKVGPCLHGATRRNLLCHARTSSGPDFVFFLRYVFERSGTQHGGFV